MSRARWCWRRRTAYSEWTTSPPMTHWPARIPVRKKNRCWTFVSLALIVIILITSVVWKKNIPVPTCEQWEPCRGAWEERLRADQGSAWEPPRRRQGTRLRPPPTTWWCSSSPLLRASSLKIEQSYWRWKTTTSLVDSSVLTTNACWNVAAFLLAMTMCVKNVFCSEWIWSSDRLNWNQGSAKEGPLWKLVQCCLTSLTSWCSALKVTLVANYAQLCNTVAIKSLYKDSQIFLMEALKRIGTHWQNNKG